MPIAVVAGTESQTEQARKLAKSLGLPFLDDLTDPATVFGVLLVCGERGLAAVPADAERRRRGRAAAGAAARRRQSPAQTAGGVGVDFTHGPTAFRRVAAGGRRQPLAAAVGLRRGCATVFDATAGLGRDAFLLACLGCRVAAVERSPIVAALLRDGLLRAQNSGDATLREVIQRITLHEGDSRQILPMLRGTERPDVVYIDTMYAASERSALSKKEMRVCRLLVGDDADAGELFQVALSAAKRRVVVKRHRGAEPLGPHVDVSHKGRSVRYDVYLTQRVTRES